MRSLDRIAHWDLQLCVKLNRVCYRLSWRVLFRCVSMLGDGIAWYGLMAVLLLRYRNEAVVPVLHMMVVGMICTAGYKLLKAHTARSSITSRRWTNSVFRQGIPCTPWRSPSSPLRTIQRYPRP
jgi:hypothetical protein